jgi:hypothetical protein
MSTSQQKWNISFFSLAIFMVIVHPQTYTLVDSLLGNIIGKIANNGCPTTLGLIVHSLVFLLVVRYSMDYDIV